ncbi:MAG: LytR/AlgR family response regulator transcription factor [Prevotella sp.]
MIAVIVDDDRKSAEHLAGRLRDYPDVVVAGMAADGVSGLSLVNSHQPDVLFLDIELPDISGMDFLERLDPAVLRRCKVIMYTAYDHFMLPAFRKRAFDYLLKPIDDKELRTVVGRLRSEKENDVALRQKESIMQRPDGKCLIYINSVDFKLVDMRDIGIFQYNHELRLWEVILAGERDPVRLKRSVNSSQLLALSDQLMQVNQKYIINLGYLIEVIDNICRFYPPFDRIDYVKVGRFFRKKLIDRFNSL